MKSPVQFWLSTFHRGNLEDLILLQDRELRLSIKGVNILHLRFHPQKADEAFSYTIVHQDPETHLMSTEGNSIQIQYSNSWWGEWAWTLEKENSPKRAARRNLTNEIRKAGFLPQLPDGVPFQKALFQSALSLAVPLVLIGGIQSLMNGNGSEVSSSNDSALQAQSLTQIPEKFKRQLAEVARASASRASAHSTQGQPRISSRAVEHLQNRVKAGSLLRQIQGSRLLAQVKGSSLHLQLGALSASQPASRNPAGQAFAGSTNEGLSGGKGAIGNSATQALASAGGAQLGKQKIALQLLPPQVEEGLSRDEVGEVIHRHSSEIRYCYETSLIHAPELNGKLVLQFTIGKLGQVTQAKAQGGSLQNAQLENCLVTRLQTWAFPKPHGGIEVPVTYPFLFKNLGSGSTQRPLKTAQSLERSES